MQCRIVRGLLPALALAAAACGADAGADAGAARGPSAAAVARPDAGAVGVERASANCHAVADSTSSTNTARYDYRNFGHYNVNFDDWGPDPGTLTQWIAGPSCWGVRTTTAAEHNGVGSYPHVARGWSLNGTLLQALSTTGFPQAPDWTTRSGLGLQVAALRKAHVGWSMIVPQRPNADNRVSRWNALMDVYFHALANPPASAWPPQIDLQIMQMLMDSPLGHQAARASGYFALTLARNHAFVKTISGVTYAGVIDSAHYHQQGGHTVTLMATPTMYTDPDAAGLLWGRPSMTHDLGGIIAWLAAADPLDDRGEPIHFADGSTVHAPVIDRSLYLSAVNAGFEIDFGTPPDDNQWTTTDFWVAVQDEADGR